MNKLYSILLAPLVLTALLLSGCTPKSSQEATGPEVAGGSSSAASAESLSFQGVDLEGNAVSSDILSQSKLTMINVWATYCNPCLSEMPGLGELAAEYNGEEFQIIGIVSDVMEGSDQDLVESLVQQTGANYTHLLLNESIYYALLTDVSAVPTTFFLDENGAVLDTVVGALEKSAWEETINGLLEGL
ncbi:TlpA family protein disulfide reductase [Pseudoflavonifractor sp. 60]|uniref:TlpA family protein disulfide reductase n=1 Tax=Pseudoflavonifractor sp. 60 TaxID=2304576 RepID=UPI00136D6896|nr:TlpA disulfide reductase family protein [Pseudoflavonifractor sp. 60]NBI67493.1 TlpA family protein disulfide reductase [Pseudoflavonifractor sp. 60]